MRFTPAFLDEIRQRLPVSQVAGRRVKLKRQGREYAGLSPFKQEKTPSFTVNDQKGFYHCFASGEHGDIFTFLMKTEGLSFAEAVERLAHEAGVPIPEASPQQREQGAGRERLRRVMEVSCAFFEESLRGASGRAARDYLERRGLLPDEIKSFRLGYAPNGRSALKQRLAGQGFSQEDMANAGMIIAGDDIPVSYDRFRHRIIFPITDPKGAIIAFGGRALDADQPAKYLNSPETPLFHKGSVLFNAARARQAAHERGAVIVAEGYMDVIALSRAGFPNTVAPLGTALTEQQLQLLWRMADEPVLCFDGDSAGRKAAYRAVETALPHLKPGASLRFAFLPDGRDPDDLVRHEGAAAMAGVLDQARPLVEVLWAKEVEAGSWTTPERRAALEKRFDELTATIGDRAIRIHYAQELRQRLRAFFSAARPYAAWNEGRRQGFASGQGQRFANGWVAHFSEGRERGRSMARGYPSGRTAGSPAFPPQQRTASLANSNLARSGGGNYPRREALILLTLINHPWLIEDHAEEIAQLELEAAALHRLRNAIIALHTEQNPLDNKQFRSHLVQCGLGDLVSKVEHAITHKSDRNSQPHAPKSDVSTGWRHMLALHRKSSELKRELEAAERAYTQEQTEENYLRLRDLFKQLSSAEGGEAVIEGYGEGLEPQGRRFSPRA